MCGKTATEFPHVTAENFEYYLTSDETLVLFFNDFLSLPSFPESLLYNQETGLFEVVTDVAESVSRAIRSVLHRSKSQLFTDDPTGLARGPQIDNRYTVCCLDKEQGMQWVMRERVPLFIQSDCYFEYRLAKLLSQRDLNPWTQRRASDSFQNTPKRVTRPLSPSQVNNGDMPKTPVGSQEKVLTGKGSSRTNISKLRPSSARPGQRTNVNPAGCNSPRCFSCFPDPEVPCTLSSSSSLSSSSASLNSEKTLEPQNPQKELNLYFTEPTTGTAEEQCNKDNSTQNSDSPDVPLEHLAAKVIDQVIREAVKEVEGSGQTHTSDWSTHSVDQRDIVTHINCSSEAENLNCSTTKNWSGLEEERGVEEKRGLEEEERGVEVKERGEEEKTNEEKRKEEGTGGKDEGNDLDICYHGARFHGSRQGLEEFKEFLRGTPGEKLLHLWMDIERLKITQDWEKRSRHLVQMRGRYLLSSSQSRLSVELLSRLGLTTPPCWTEEKLHLVQPSLTEALLNYWVPRFRTSQRVQEDGDEPSDLDPWTERYLRPPSGIEPFPRCIALHPLRPDTCLPRASNTAHTQQPYYSSSSSSSSSSPVLGSRRMERMLQALYVESQAGFYFTQFCERSGNQLWQNVIHFWCDLQQYHLLFYQDGLDLYRVQRQAQLLYSSYLCSSARRSIGVDEESRRSVYGGLKPAFEELFDEVEEHALTLLLEPWTLLITRDRGSYLRVCVQEEVRQVDSEEYRELQSLYEESEHRLQQVQQCIAAPSAPSPHLPPEGPGEPNPWSNVSPRYHGYRLGSLLRQHQEIQHFQKFLQNHDASIHLTCWLDLEQYKRTPQKDNTTRQERSSYIKTKYLNRKYFFGPDSPASAEQQDDIMHLVGGPERLKHERLSNSVVTEVQNIVRSHIEKTWLPLFLSTPEFTERQKHKPHATDRLSEQVYRRQRKRRGAWKRTAGLWMSSSKEILVLRRVLLNPVTCQQFQHFVSLKGLFLENDVLFWLEVQRYKNLCHSHSDEATIQRKVSTIISCFINSSTPPALQIDIPPEQAQHILEKRRELGPYIFREAQMTVFSELLKLWPRFEALRGSVKEEQLLPLLEEKKEQHRARLQRRRRKEEEEVEEERRAQEEAERPESSLTEEEEEEEVDGRGMHREREGRGEQKDKLTRRQGKVLYTPTQQISWSYSKYMEALRREEVLLKRRNQLDAVTSFSTVSGSSSGLSPKSAVSRHSQHRSSTLSPRTDNIQPI